MRVAAGFALMNNPGQALTMQTQRMKQLMKNCIYIAIATFIVCLLFYCCYVCFSCTSVYLAVKQKARGWSGRVHQYDGQLGFAPIPGATGFHVFPVGPDIPMRYGKDGFRVSADEPAHEHCRPLFLFLGCSYTYGDACRFEDTFPYLVEKHFGGTALNAGVCGYGLTQMQILAQRLVPRYRPEFVIVQYSDWLVNRATREFSPTYFLKIPYPYYTDSGDGFAIAPPVYRTAGFDKDISLYRKTPAGIADFLSFMTTVAVPLQAAENMRYLAFVLRKAAGITQRPTERKKAALDFCYLQIQQLCRQYSATMIVLGLRDQSYAIGPEFVYVNAEKGLRDSLAPGADYGKAFSHWRGDPPVKVDNHPNPDAHKIIAGQLIKKIEELQHGGPEGNPAKDSAAAKPGGGDRHS